MSYILEKFKIFSEISAELKQCIRYFHIFDEQNSVLFVTTDDQVLTFGYNFFGKCGVGRDEPVETPEFLPELCRKGIKQFSIGNEFVLALSQTGQVFSWGKGFLGELGKGYRTSFKEYSKPELISSLENIVELSCGNSHCLALTSDGFVYGWGFNSNGQVGCGQEEEIIDRPIRLKSLMNIQSIYCSHYQSFAVTYDGLVYSWGDNKQDLLGHQQNGEFNEPKLITGLTNIKCVGTTKYNTYFISNDGSVYFCGKLANSTANQKTPKLLETNLKFDFLYSNYHFSKAFGLIDQSIYYLKGNGIRKTKYKSLIDLYAFELKLTLNTIDLNEKLFTESKVFKSFEKMSDILEYFDDFSEINTEFKVNIKLFHIIDDKSGHNILFVTHEDHVFAFGSNYFGRCGSGHNNRVIKPELILELCGQRIKQFIIGKVFTLAVNQENQVFGWGQNSNGELGRGYISEDKQYLKPEIIPSLEDIKQISCGNNHSLALTSDGAVFGWGDNMNGQIGFEKKGPAVLEPLLLKSFARIKSVYCFNDKSFAVTSDGKVYYWGNNLVYKMFEPSLLNLSDVRSVGCANQSTYFLTNDGNIHYCKSLSDNTKENPNSFEIMKSDEKFNSMQPINGKTLALSEDNSVYVLNYNWISKTNYKKIFDFCLNSQQITPKTVELDFEMRFNGKLEDMDELGSGGFGNVYRVENKMDKKIWAVKVCPIVINEKNLLEKLNKEVKLMSDCKKQYVAQYLNSWIENDMFYIQMELCSDNLENIIKEKPNCFGRDSSDPIDYMEYHISCLISKEIIECVQYLHQLDPPIIHRDLKPENILINYLPKNGRFLKLCDFGLATLGGKETISHTRDVGSLKYMAPEIVDGILGSNQFRVKYSTKADVYSLGKIFCDMFHMDKSSSAESIANTEQLTQKCIELKKLVNQMLSDTYQERPTCSDLLNGYELWAIGEIVKSDEYVRVMNQIKEFDIPLFYNYLNPDIFDESDDPDNSDGKQTQNSDQNTESIESDIDDWLTSEEGSNNDSDDSISGLLSKINELDQLFKLEMFQGNQ